MRVAGRAKIGVPLVGNGASEDALNAPDHKKPRPHWACGAGCAYEWGDANHHHGTPRGHVAILAADSRNKGKAMLMLAALAAAASSAAKDETFRMVTVSQDALQLCLVIEGTDSLGNGADPSTAIIVAGAVCRPEFQRMRRVYRDYTLTYVDPRTPDDVIESMATDSLKKLLTTVQVSLEKHVGGRTP